MHQLRAKRVLLGVGGGIAAYKAAEIVRALDGAGADVQVAMTRAATSFITPLTLQTLSRRAVATELLDPAQEDTIGHIRLAEEADVVLVAAGNCQSHLPHGRGYGRRYRYRRAAGHSGAGSRGAGHEYQHARAPGP